MKYACIAARVALIGLGLATTVNAQNGRGGADSVFVWSARLAEGG